MQIERLNTTIQTKTTEKEQWRSIALGITAGGQSTLVEVKGKYELQNMEKVQSSGSQSKMADAVVRCVDIEREITALIDELINTKHEIAETLRKLKPKHYYVLFARYVEGKRYKEIGAEKDKSISWAKTVHREALRSLQKVLDAQAKN